MAMKGGAVVAAKIRYDIQLTEVMLFHKKKYIHNIVTIYSHNCVSLPESYIIGLLFKTNVVCAVNYYSIMLL